MIVSSSGALQSFDGPTALTPLPATSGASRASGAWIGGFDHYACIYRTQPWVRICVDEIARQMAQIGIHVFRRLSDTDRERLPTHDVARWLGAPNPATTKYRLIEALLQDIGIYNRAYWWKFRRSDGDLGLLRLPPAAVYADGYLVPSLFTWTLPDGNVQELPAAQVVSFHGYDPTGLDPLSPLETLRRTLAAEEAGLEYRERYWGNAARLEGVIERPATAPKWTKEQKDSWREQWGARHVDNPGTTAVLEDGMTWKSITQSWSDAEYIAARKLTREEVAAAYHIPAPMVGILDHATFSNVKEQHKQLYQDTLGPLAEMIALEIERQLLPEAADTDRIYVEFNIADKLKGSFDEMATSLYRLTGRPIMTANEGRAKLNLPSIKDDDTADTLVMPVNVATPDGATRAAPGAQVPDPVDAIDAELADEDVAAGRPAAAQLEPVLSATFARQLQQLEKLPQVDRPAAFGRRALRWDRELAADLLPLYHGVDADAALRDAARLAARVNADTARLLLDGSADPFTGREWGYAEPLV